MLGIGVSSRFSAPYKQRQRGGGQRIPQPKHHNILRLADQQQFSGKVCNVPWLPVRSCWWTPRKAAEPYFTDSVQSVFCAEISHLLRRPRAKVQSNISYLPNQAQYKQRLLRSLQDRNLPHHVPPGLPKAIGGSLVWEASRLKEDQYIYYLTQPEVEEIDRALVSFKGTS